MSNSNEKENPTRKEKLRINRGVELILSKRSTQKPTPNIIRFQFEKLISFLKEKLMSTLNFL